MSDERYRFEPPVGKTVVKLLTSPYQQDLKRGDICYVDGHVRAGDNRAYLVLVRMSDGVFGYAANYEVRAHNCHLIEGSEG